MASELYPWMMLKEKIEPPYQMADNSAIFANR